MRKSDPVEQIDLNLIHYLELHVHGANSSVRKDYIEARDLIESGKINADALVTHKFGLDDFTRAVEGAVQNQLMLLQISDQRGVYGRYQAGGIGALALIM